MRGRWHLVRLRGKRAVIFLEMFKAPRYQDISLNEWLTHIPPELVRQHLGISEETLATIPKHNLALLPG